MKNCTQKVLVIVLLSFLSSSLWAATFTVSTTADAGPGSLRQAISDANNNAGSGPHTIVFNLPVGSTEIALLTALPTINSNVTIVGVQGLTLSRSASATVGFRHFQISSGRTVTMKNLTLANGAPAAGQAAGSIYVQGSLTLENCILRDNITTGSGAHGGAIWNEGTLVLEGCQLLNNTSSGEGGALINRTAARLTITNSVIANNTAAGSGGGIAHNVGASTFTNSISACFIRNNRSSGQGGGINNNGRLLITNSQISGNACLTSGRGGGIGNEGTTTVNLTLLGCTINGNSAVSNGGGIHFYNGTGAVYNVTNCTISGNTSTTGQGGGLATNISGTINNTTIALNSSSGNGGGLRVFLNTTEVNYSIIAGNNLSNSDVRGRDIDGNRTSAYGRNLVGTAGSSPYGSWSGVTTGNNTSNIDVNSVLQATLTDNGGPVPTHALIANSVAINPSAAAGYNQPFDQRGYSRSGSIDIGAFEWGGGAVAVQTAAASSIRIGSVVFNGTVQSGGSLVQVFFDYGKTTAYGASTLGTTSYGGTVAVPVSQNFEAGALYHFRLRALYGAANEFTLLGEDQTFTAPAPNAAPILTASAGNRFLYTAVANILAVDPTLLVSDEDNQSLVGAFVQITGNFKGGEDELTATPVGGITVQWNAAASGGGLLFLSGNASLSDYQALLQSVRYKNNKGENADYAPRTVQFKVDDGLNYATATKNIILAFNENGPLFTKLEGVPLVFTEKGPPVALSTSLQLSDPNSTELQSATVEISGQYKAGEDLLALTTQNGITGTWDATAGKLTLSGAAPVHQYEAAIRSVTYNNTSLDPSTAARTLTIRASDGENGSNPVTRIVQVVAVNDAPVISGLETTAVLHAENSAPVPVISSLTITDVDNTTLSSARVAITTNYRNGQDILSFTPQNGISGTWNAATGTLQLSGIATLLQYEQALQTVRYYQQTSYNWSGGERTLQFFVNDGAANSNGLSRTIVVSPKAPVTFNYAEALQKSLYFYEAQRAGVLPERGKNPGQNRVEWRGNSLLTDGSDAGLDLTGGWYDAGDTYKCNSSMAYAATFLAWSGLEYNQAYTQNGQQPFLLDNLKFINNYFLKCFVNDNPGQYRYYTQVTSGALAHNYWVSPEVLDEMTVFAGVNPSYRIDVDCKGSDVAGQTAATFASSSIVFRNAGDVAYADLLLEKARRMFHFGDAYQGVDGHRNAAGIVSKNQNYFYRDNNYWDEMMWAAIWLHKAEKAAGTTGYTDAYLAKANDYYNQQPDRDNRFAHFRELSFATVDKAAFVLLVPETTGELQKTYRQRVENWLDWWTIGYTDRVRYTAGGMATKTTQTATSYAPLRYSTNQAFVAGIYSDWMTDGTGANGTAAPLANPALTSVDRKAVYDAFAQRQVNYALGDNPAQRSFVVGMGPNPYNMPHHRAAHGPWAGFEHLIAGKPEFNNTKPRHVLYGGLLGGPGKTDGNFLPLDDFDAAENNISNSVTNEVALDFNAGLPGAFARLWTKYPQSGTVLADFPAAEEREDEFFVEAKVEAQTENSISVKLHLNNRSSWPARVSDKLSARYYFTLDGGASLQDVVLTKGIVLPNTNTQGGTLALKHYYGNIYYVEADFTGRKIFPGGLVPTTNSTNNVFWMREANFTLSAPGWNNSNDWSYNGLAPLSVSGVAKTGQVPVYENVELLFGTEPENNAPVVQTATLAVDERKPVGTTVGTVEASDADGGVLTYSITAGNEEGMFAINPATGALTLAAVPDHEAKAQYQLTVRATDDFVPAKWGTAVVTIDINDVRNLPQLITFQSIGDKVFGTEPFGLTATASSGLPVRFSLVSGLATLSGNSVLLTGYGPVTLKALQDGDGDFAAAPPVQQTFTVVYSSDGKAKLVPLVDCVEKIGNQYFAWFGYKSDLDAPIFVPSGAANHLQNGTPGDKPDVFQPGLQKRVFKTLMQSASTSWYLQGPDGKLREATATIKDPCVHKNAATVAFVGGKENPEVRTETGVGLYPNPAQRFVLISLPAQQGQVLTAVLMQSDGKVVQQDVLKPSSGAFRFDFKKRYAAGIYIIQVKGKDFSRSFTISIAP